MCIFKRTQLRYFLLIKVENYSKAPYFIKPKLNYKCHNFVYLVFLRKIKDQYLNEKQIIITIIKKIYCISLVLIFTIKMKLFNSFMHKIFTVIVQQNSSHFDTILKLCILFLTISAHKENGKFKDLKKILTKVLKKSFRHNRIKDNWLVISLGIIMDTITKGFQNQSGTSP